jgi:hypothetical protein
MSGGPTPVFSGRRLRCRSHHAAEAWYVEYARAMSLDFAKAHLPAHERAA